MLGYLGDPAATAAAVTDAGGAFARATSADSTRPAGCSLTGRLKDLIISGGHEHRAGRDRGGRLPPPELVAAAAAVGIPDARWGETPVWSPCPRTGTRSRRASCSPTAAPS